MTLHRGFYLGREAGPMGVALVDGVHGDIEGVARAAKLHRRIFGDLGPFVMVEVHEMPTLDPPINEQAADDCAAMLGASNERQQADWPPWSCSCGATQGNPACRRDPICVPLEDAEV